MRQRDFNAERLAIARAVFARLHAQWGEHLIAAAVYGSVAHGDAGAESDVELTIITDEAVPYTDISLFEDGTLVEYTLVEAERMLAAARRVPENWGIEADQYRHHLILWDPGDFFTRLWQAARAIPDAAFDDAQRALWWRAYEGRGKLRNAIRANDPPRIHYSAWQFAYTTALRIALHDHQPYESLRTIWQDVAARGFAMPDLLAALTASDVDRIGAAIEHVWEATQPWGKPE
ncbi:MAG: kanamycin nucleotidyltransferase C-terminal domain-containing protein [Ktedonobacterales bacterium]